MEFKTLFESYRDQTKKRLSTVLEENSNDFSSRLGKQTDLFNILMDFSTKGKMLRGSLFLFSAESYGKKIDADLLNVAASLELMHSALLIHDDIMDNDELRRGEKTIFVRYKDDAKKEKIKNPEHYGISMGIVLGDICLFIAEELASYCDNLNIKKLLQFYTKELRFVGIGQFLDFSYGAKNLDVSSDEIKKMYINKSARYSFSLPLGLGAIAANSSDDEIKILESLGEKVGLIFQLIDDDIGMFGDESKIGKPVGSDIRENKKTFMRSLLMQNADSKTKDFLDNTFGNDSISIENIESVQKLIIDLGVRGEIGNMIDNLYQDSKNLIDKLNISDDYRKIYNEVLDYNVKREF